VAGILHVPGTAAVLIATAFIAALVGGGGALTAAYLRK
jgi:hypothetical protein